MQRSVLIPYSQTGKNFLERFASGVLDVDSVDQNAGFHAQAPGQAQHRRQGRHSVAPLDVGDAPVPSFTA